MAGFMDRNYTVLYHKQTGGVLGNERRDLEASLEAPGLGGLRRSFCCRRRRLGGVGGVVGGGALVAEQSQPPGAGGGERREAFTHQKALERVVTKRRRACLLPPPKVVWHGAFEGEAEGDVNGRHSKLGNRCFQASWPTAAVAWASTK